MTFSNPSTTAVASAGARTGLHSERGPETVGHLIRLVGAHDLVHRAQIERILSSTS